MKAIANRFNLRGQQLLRDIFEFRMLLLNLVYFDAVEFYIKVLNLRNTANFESIWYIGDRRTMEDIENLLKFAKQRVFKLKRDIAPVSKPIKRQLTQEEEGLFEGDIIEEPISLSVVDTDPHQDPNLEGGDDSNVKEEGESTYLDIVKNPIKYKGNNYRLDLKININFKYKALVEILKNLTNDAASDKGSQATNGSRDREENKGGKKKIIWIWAQEDKKVDKVKDILTSFFAKKDEHKIKLVLRLHGLLAELGIDKKDKTVPNEDYEDEEFEQFKNARMKKNSSEADMEKFVFKKLNEDLFQIKKEYDNKVMMNLFNRDAPKSNKPSNVFSNNIDNISNSMSNGVQSQSAPLQSEESSGAQLMKMLNPKRKLKRKFYDLDDDDDDAGNNETEKKDSEKMNSEVQPATNSNTGNNTNTNTNGDLSLISNGISNLNPVGDAGDVGDADDGNDGFSGMNGDRMGLNDDGGDTLKLTDEEENEETQTLKRVLKNDDLANGGRGKKKYEYSILNPDKIDLNSFYSYNDAGQVVFDSEIIPGYKIIVNSLGSTSERVNFINRTQPDIVILFEPQLSLLREIMLEKRCAKHGGQKCIISEVHILMVQNSIESAIYLDNVRRENSSFVTLLNERSSLPLLDDNPDSRIKKIIYHRNVSTRVGRGLGHAINLANRPMIIVDKREFNSPVPAKLYHDGFWVIPILLEKGDYVLSNTLVIERKCVETGDLFNSMRCGRLETQIRNMCQTYTRPMLLIEFSEGIEFSLESTEINRLQHNISWLNDFESDKSEINKSNVKFGLSLLCMKYPKLTILWSKSPEYTSKLFQRLREENPDPDPRLFAKFQEESEKNNECDPFARHIKEDEDAAELKTMG